MKQNEDVSNDKKKKNSLLISLIAAVLCVILFHFEFGIGRFGLMEMISSSGKATWSYMVLLLAIFFISFALIFLFAKGILKVKKGEISEEEKKKRRSIRTEIVFVAIDVIMTIMFVGLNKQQLGSIGLMLAIAEVAAFFAVVWMGFEFFNRFKFFPQKIFKFVFGFLIYICIPMLFLLVIMLGAYQEKYGYQDTFKPQIGANAVIFAENMRLAYYDLISTLYNIGQINPDLWIWLPVVAFFFMTLWLLISTFTKKEKTEPTANELILEVIKEEEEEKAYERGEKKRPLAYNFLKKIGDWMKSEKEKKQELKEKEEEKNAKYNIYDVTLTQMKGGRING